MGSFCGQGSQNKVTETQTYNPSAGGIAALNNANYWLNTVNPANAPLLNVNAPNAGQTGAYQGFMNLVNQNPFAAYSTRAMNLYDQSTQRGDVDQYLNPYRDEALAAMKRYNFDPATRQAMGASRGASGGVGAARSGLTAANLAKSQADATTGALANYYQSAEQMAANQRMMQQAAAYGVGNLGTADVNQRLAGLSGELGAGNNLWQYQQAPNQALYNQQMLQFTTPFQLAGAYAGMAPAWGGTQTGEKNYPAPGILQQIAGLGMAGLGIYGGMGGKFSNPFAGWGGGGQARGGAIKHAALGGSMYSGLPQSGGFDPSFNPYQQLQTYFNNNFRRRAAQPMQAQSMQARPPVGNEIAQGAPQVPSGLPTSNPFMPTPAPTPQSGLPEVGNNPDMGTGLPIGTPQGSLGPSSMTPPMPTLGGGTLPSPVTGTAVLPGQNWINPIMGTPTGGVGGLISGTSPEQSNPFSMGIRGFADGGDTANEIDNELFGQEDLRQEGIDKLRSAMTPPARPPRSLNLSDENLISIAKEGDPDSKFDAIRAGGERGDLPSVVSDNFKPVFPETPGYASRNDEGLGAVGVDVPPVRSLPAIPSLGGAQAAGQGDTSTKLASNPWMALVQAGLGTMAASGERDARGLPLTGIAAIGKGGMKGVAELNQQREEARKDALAKFNAGMQQVPYSQMTAEQAATNKLAQERLTLEREKMEEAGWKQTYDLTTGKPLFVNPRTKEMLSFENGKLVAADPNTVKPAESNEGIEAAQKQRGVFDYRSPSQQDLDKGPKYLPNTGRMRPELEVETKKIMDSARTGNLSAQRMELRMQQLEHEFKNVDTAKGVSGYLLSAGTGNTFRLGVARAINTAFGAQIVDPKAIGSLEDINKQVVFMGQEKARELGAREAAQVIQQTIAANPNAELTPDGRKKIIAGLRAAADRQRDFGKFVQEYRQANGGSAAGADVAFDRTNPPERYVAKAIVSVLPENKQKEVPQAVEILRRNKDNPRAIDAFNKEYGNTAHFFLSGAF